MTQLDKLMDISRIYNLVSMVFPHFDRWEGNWEDTYRGFLQRTLETGTDREHALLMAEFVNTLKDGHTDISFSREILDGAGYFPFRLEYAQGRYYHQGAEVLKIDGIPMERLLQRAGKYAYCVEAFCPRLSYFLPFLLPEGTHSLETARGKVPFSMLSQKPAQQNLPLTFTSHGDVLQIVIGDFLGDYGPAIRKVLEERKPGKVILDVRRNIGGMTQRAADVAQLFLPGTFSGSRKWTREHSGVALASASQGLRMGPKAQEALAQTPSGREELRQAREVAHLAAFKTYQDSWGKEDTPAVFTGPLVLLTSRETVSAAEDFVSFFRSNHRATLIGEPTCGTSGTPLLAALSCGTLRVCSVGYRLLDGTQWLGQGIQPDVPAAPTPEDMAQRIDRVLETALTYLA